MDANENQLITEIEKLIKSVKIGEYSEEFKSGKVTMLLLQNCFHAYEPLLYVNQQDAVQVTPVPLNRVEKRFVDCLKVAIEHKHNNGKVANKEIYLMRNLSRGKGIAFFDDYHFYPDFIIWLKDKNRQDIVFIDPKGLVRFDSKIRSKVDLHKRIKDTEKKIQQSNPTLFLHSYIWTETSLSDIGSDKPMTPAQWQANGVFSTESNMNIAERMMMKLLKKVVDEETEI